MTCALLLCYTASAITLLHIFPRQCRCPGTAFPQVRWSPEMADGHGVKQGELTPQSRQEAHFPVGEAELSVTSQLRARPQAEGWLRSEGGWEEVGEWSGGWARESGGRLQLREHMEGFQFRSVPCGPYSVGLARWPRGQWEWPDSSPCQPSPPKHQANGHRDGVQMQCLHSVTNCTHDRENIQLFPALPWMTTEPGKCTN